MSNGKRNIENPVSLRQKVVNLVIHLLGWIGIAVCYYIIFYSFFDTPLESRLKEETKMLEQQYAILQARYDTIDRVLHNIEERDRNVYISLFEADPYSNDNHNNAELIRDSLSKMSNIKLSEIFESRVAAFERRYNQLENSLIQLVDSMPTNNVIAYIPKIKPITDKNNTSLVSSFGMRIQPFYKSITMHRGVDFAVSEGSRVYATADGTVSEVNSKKGASSGISVTITHGKSGYKTFYGHLSRASVRKGQRVRQGDIIGLSGNSGLSFAPHLHYEVLLNGSQVDPIHYFFNEVAPWQSAQLRAVASSGMQSLD